MLLPVLQYADIPGDDQEGPGVVDEEEDEEWVDGEDEGGDELIQGEGSERTVYVDAEGQEEVELVRSPLKELGDILEDLRDDWWLNFVQAAGVGPEEEVPILKQEEDRLLAERLEEAKVVEREVVAEEEKAATVVESVEVEKVKARGRPKVK